MGFVNKWVLDTNPKAFIEERSLKPDLFIVKDNEEEGWIYDNMEGVVHLDIVYEFRRRRLYRECYRYARPHKRPKSAQNRPDTFAFCLFIFNSWHPKNSNL